MAIGQFGPGNVVIGIDAHLGGLLPHQIPHCVRGIACDAEEPVRHHDCTRVDEGVPGNPFLAFQLDQRVERVTRRLPEDPFPDSVAVKGQHQRERENLGDALDGEIHVASPAE